jgi:hypothetical protein
MACDILGKASLFRLIRNHMATRERRQVTCPVERSVSHDFPSSPSTPVLFPLELNHLLNSSEKA